MCILRVCICTTPHKEQFLTHTDGRLCTCTCNRHTTPQKSITRYLWYRVPVVPRIFIFTRPEYLTYLEWIRSIRSIDILQDRLLVFPMYTTGTRYRSIGIWNLNQPAWPVRSVKRSHQRKTKTAIVLSSLTQKGISAEVWNFFFDLIPIYWHHIHYRP